MEVPREIIVRFHDYEEKNLIWGNMKGKPPIKYEEKKWQLISRKKGMQRKHSYKSEKVLSKSSQTRIACRVKILSPLRPRPPGGGGQKGSKTTKVTEKNRK